MGWHDVREHGGLAAGHGPGDRDARQPGVYDGHRGPLARCYWSAINNTLDWTTANNAGFIDIEPNDGSIIIDLVPSIQELVILKGRRPYRLQGIGPATGYTLQDHVVPATGAGGGDLHAGRRVCDE